jgi:hypothetical protein
VVALLVDQSTKYPKFKGLNLGLGNNMEKCIRHRQNQAGAKVIYCSNFNPIILRAKIIRYFTVIYMVYSML